MLKLVENRKNESSYIQNLEYLIKNLTNTLVNCFLLYVVGFLKFNVWILTIDRTKK